MSQNLLVVQGEYQVSDQAGAVISTLLGSCIATCLFDLRVGVGGLNHFLLAGDNGIGGEKENLKYGVHAMELLINSLLRLGARKENLQAKLFGGARMSENFRDISTENIRFAEQFLETEQIACVGKSVGGNLARRLRFFPSTGRVQLRLVDRSTVVELPSVNPPISSGSGLDLF